VLRCGGRVPVWVTTHLRNKFAFSACTGGVAAGDTPGSRHRLPDTPAIGLPKPHTVLFVLGCFWHRPSGCTTIARSRSQHYPRIGKATGSIPVSTGNTGAG